MPEFKKAIKQKGEIERRFIKTSDFRVEDDGKKIVGYAAKFNVLAPEYFGFKEKIAKGTFLKTIKEGDIRALFNHNPDYVLGRNKAGTLKLKEDDKGLHYEIIPPDTNFANDLKESIKRGDISQSSFGFKVIKDEWTEDEEKGLIREIKEVKLYDVSPVTYPWYPTTEASVCSEISKIGSEVRSLFVKLLNNEKLNKEEIEIVKRNVTDLTELQKESKSATWKYCICDCGYWEEKTAGDACKLIKCPDCGKELTGSNEKSKSKDKKSEPLEQHSKVEKPLTHFKTASEVLKRKLDLFEFES